MQRDIPLESIRTTAPFSAAPRRYTTEKIRQIIAPAGLSAHSRASAKIRKQPENRDKKAHFTESTRIFLDTLTAPS